MESLEPRWVFSAAPLGAVGDAAVCVPEPETVAAAEGESAALVSIGPAYPVLPNSSTQLNQPLAPTSVDRAMEMDAEEDAAEGEGTYVLNLTMNLVQNLYGEFFFTGSVTKQRDVGTITIKFGGLLDGHTCAVQADGSFQYRHVFPAGTIGQVTGQAVGSLGYESNVVTKNLFYYG